MSGIYQAWTDGGAQPNPGKGGWGYVLKDSSTGQTWAVYGGDSETTNNRMEMTAILRALQAVPDGARIKVFSDSSYCVNGLTKWRAGWKKKRWMKAGKPMLNRDLWLLLEDEMARVFASFEWVKGHAGNPNNERADRLATQGRKSLT